MFTENGYIRFFNKLVLQWFRRNTNNIDKFISDTNNTYYTYIYKNIEMNQIIGFSVNGNFSYMNINNYEKLSHFEWSIQSYPYKIYSNASSDRSILVFAFLIGF